MRSSILLLLLLLLAPLSVVAQSKQGVSFLGHLQYSHTAQATQSQDQVAWAVGPDYLYFQGTTVMQGQSQTFNLLFPQAEKAYYWQTQGHFWHIPMDFRPEGVPSVTQVARSTEVQELLGHRCVKYTALVDGTETAYWVPLDLDMGIHKVPGIGFANAPFGVLANYGVKALPFKIISYDQAGQPAEVYELTDIRTDAQISPLSARLSQFPVKPVSEYGAYLQSQLKK